MPAMRAKQKPNTEAVRQRWGVGPQVTGLNVPWILPPPHLPTLEALPSWISAWGHIDHSACFALWVSDLRRLYGCLRNHVPPDPDTGRRLRARPLPGQQPARNHLGRLATAEMVLTKPMLQELLSARPERAYPGDFRTLRSPAMRPANWQPPPPDAPQPSNPYHTGWKGFRNRRSQHQTLHHPAQGLDPNPNAGPWRTKTLALPPDWLGPIRVEKWLTNPHLPCYYMICPAGPAGIEDPARPQFARLSTAARGQKRPWGTCPQRVRNLMMVLCTPQEALDANLAQAWIQRLPLNPGRRTQERWNEVVEVVNRLAARYGQLFAPRRLICRHCLQVRYANTPKAIRPPRNSGTPEPRPASVGSALAEHLPFLPSRRVGQVFGPTSSPFSPARPVGRAMARLFAPGPSGRHSR